MRGDHELERMARETLLDPLRIPEEHVFRMRGEDDPRDAAALYGRVLAQQLGAAADVPDGVLFLDAPLPGAPRARPVVMAVAAVLGLVAVIALLAPSGGTVVKWRIDPMGGSGSHDTSECHSSPATRLEFSSALMTRISGCCSSPLGAAGWTCSLPKRRPKSLC